MDDTAFHYSRTLRIIVILAILVPILVIGTILWYFGRSDASPIPYNESGSHTTAVP